MRAPQNPTIVPSSPILKKDVILFAPELSDFIRKEGKVKTYRYGYKYEYLKIGGQVELREYQTNNLISKAEITSKKYTTFKDIPLNLEGHEIYDSKEHQRRIFSSYYKYLGRKIEDNDPFIIISFKLI